MATIDHTACTHPRTPAGRAACRKLRAGLATVSTDAYARAEIRMNRDSQDDPDVRAAFRRVTDEIKMTGPVARRMARTAAKADNARIQPRRSGARVAVDSSTCVQAALHTSRGLCACGHMTGEFRVAA